MNASLIRQQELQHKAAVLKQYEVYGYQVACYILEDEALAAQAVMQAFKQLFQDGLFFEQPQPVQKLQTKRAVMKHSLLSKSAAIPSSHGIT
ncbi:hypothetical protein BBD42_29315 [Paenibacillus sp. BIHB 4019]|uniref:Uncharacterized protein n=1 Tax=Paenibacillus sp. BIHB 4019 TaxID=1870819 RepID=A0A1B2DQZ8_9BACL|nr:hypothetical protein [Paenibacillus sp. BIHB 4019]ANY70144.1 hypothetical protein BBD42_29315 [Paenibacillus sp. BIHB 4019]